MTRVFRFSTVEDAAKFVASAASTANELDHHPTLEWRGREVTVVSVTHDAGGAETARDHALMARLEAMATHEAPAASPVTTHRGACHCGAVRFEADGALEHVVVCNCSWCARTGFLHWNVSPDAFRVLQGADVLTDYQFGTRTSHNTFCRTCGVAPFRRPRSDPHLIDVNVRCLEGVDVAALRLQSFDGQHWEGAITTRTWR